MDSGAQALDRPHTERFVERDRGRIVLADLEINVLRASVREDVESSQHQPAAQPSSPHARGHGEILYEGGCPALRETRYALIIARDEDQGGIVFLVLAQRFPPLAENWRAAPALPVSGFQHGVGRLKQFEVWLLALRLLHYTCGPERGFDDA